MVGQSINFGEPKSVLGTPIQTLLPETDEIILCRSVWLERQPTGPVVQVRYANLGLFNVSSAVVPIHPALRYELLREIIPLWVAVDLIRVVHNEHSLGNKHTIDYNVLVCLARESESNRREVRAP
jgi:hypothetical protein